VGQQSAKRNAISLQRWEVAKGVYRFTLSEQLSPGEYVMAQMLSEGMNIYVWDFGIDGSGAGETKAQAAPPKKPRKPAASKP
jgi:hypothetical protein